MTENSVEELQSEMVKLAQDAATEGYNQGILTATEILRKVAELNPQNAEILNTCAQVLEDLIKEKMK
jgi:hypothetical protein